MPVQFLSPEQRINFGKYLGDPSGDELPRYFHLDDTDRAVITVKRGDHNRLGFALQLTTARFLGTFLEDPINVPPVVLQTLARQLHRQQARTMATLSQRQSALGARRRNPVDFSL